MSLDHSSKHQGLLKGLSYRTPIDGTIRMGRVAIRNGRRLPEKDDQFTITQKFKNPETGDWKHHDINAPLSDKYGVSIDPATEGAAKKLRKIPIVLAFDTPSLTLTEQYAAFSKDGRPKCVGNGCKAKRINDVDSTGAPVLDVDCPGPFACEYGKENRCDAIARLMVQIDDEAVKGQTFILRTGSFNAVSDCRTVLEGYKQLFGGLAGLPLWLTLEAKSSSMSMNTTFWYASLKPRFGDFFEAASLIASRKEKETSAKLNREAYESTLVSLMGNGSFSETQEDAEQFEDLIIGRFVDQDQSGGNRSVTVGITPSAAATSVVELTQRLVAQSQDAANACTPKIHEPVNGSDFAKTMA
jgi:hypothetical protein